MPLRAERSEKDRLESFYFEKSEVSSAKILQVESMSQGKSFIYMRKRSALNTDPCETHVRFLFPRRTKTIQD